MAACPPSEQLRGFASGILSDDVAAAIGSHVTTCYECQTSVRDFAKGTGDAPLSSPDAEARIGRELGRYRVDRVLGMGGMGIVYAAWDPQLDRPVAIKVVHRAAADAAGRARLVREAQSLARLSHPNVCHVYDVGTAPSPDNPEGDVWVAMELVDGKSLREWVHGKTQDQILAVLFGAGDGIAAAHAAGLIHRDIKPENVLVTHDGRPVVTDFGLARLDLPVDPTGATGMIDPLKTATNAIVGTPAYLAPEQLTGGVLDHRVDQFAWAVMAWELLAGVRPFPAIPIVRLDAIVAGPKAPPSMAKQFIAPLARGMAAAPRDRYGSLRELIDALKLPAPKPKSHTGVIAAGAAVAAVAVTVVVWKLVSPDASLQPEPVILVAPPKITMVDKPVVAPAPAPNAAPPVVETGSAAPPNPAVVAPAPTPTPAPTPKLDPKKPVPTKPDPTKPGPTKPDPKNEQTVGKGQTPGVAPKAPPPPNPVDDPNAGGGNAPAPAPAGALEAFLAQHPYNRSSAVAVLDMMCRIPVDAANPGPEKGRHGIVDWGRVTRRELGEVKLGNRSHHAPLYEVKGARGTYQFKADHWSNTVGIPDAKVGQWVALCYDDITEIYEVPPNWKRQMVRLQGIVPLSRPPRVDEIKKWNPLHTSYLSFKRDGGYGKTSMDTSRAYFFQAKVEGLESGIRYDMGGWWMDVPAGIKGANLVGVGKRLWFVVEKLRFEDPPDGNKSKLVVTAVAVIDDLFP